MTPLPSRSGCASAACSARSSCVLGQHPMRRLMPVDERADIDDHRLAHLEPRLERRRGHVRRQHHLVLPRQFQQPLADRRCGSRTHRAPRPLRCPDLDRVDQRRLFDQLGPRHVHHKRRPAASAPSRARSRMWCVSRVSGVCSDTMSTAPIISSSEWWNTASSLSSSCGGRRLREK